MKRRFQVLKGVTSVEMGRNSRMENKEFRHSVSLETAQDWASALRSGAMRLQELSTDHLGYWEDKNISNIADTQVEAEWLSDTEDQIFHPDSDKILRVALGAIEAGMNPEEIPMQFKSLFKDTVASLAYELSEDQVLLFGDPLLEWVRAYGDADAVQEILDIKTRALDDIELDHPDIHKASPLDSSSGHDNQDALPDIEEKDDVTRDSGGFIPILEDIEEDPPTEIDPRDLATIYLDHMQVSKRAFIMVAKNPSDFGLDLPRLELPTFNEECGRFFALEDRVRDAQDRMNQIINTLPQWKRYVPGVFSKEYRETHARWAALHVQLRVERIKMDQYMRAFRRAESDMLQQASQTNKKKAQG